MVELLPVSTWTLCVTRCILWTSCFLTLIQFFQDDNLHTYTARSVQSWLEQREDALQHFPWPAQSSDLNIIETLWSVLESTVTSGVPPPSSLKQLEDVLDGEWHNIALETVQNLYECIARRTQAVLQAMLAQLCSIFHSRFR
jgi:hypothetical protein